MSAKRNWVILFGETFPPFFFLPYRCLALVAVFLRVEHDIKIIYSNNQLRVLPKPEYSEKEFNFDLPPSLTVL